MIQTAEFESAKAKHAALPILLQYWQVLLRWRWVAAGIIAGALAMGLLVTLLTTPQYTATAQIEIARVQKNITNVQGVENPNAGQDLEFYQTQYNLLSARTLAERVVRSLRLAQDDRFFDGHGTDADSGLFDSGDGLRNSRAQREEREGNAVELLLDHVEISPIRGSALVDIHYTSGSPQLSAEIANEWTRQYIASTMDRRFNSTADARTFLEGRLADLRTRLEESERNVVNYASNKGIVNLRRTNGAETTEGTLVAADLEALNEQLIEATADRIAAESSLRSGSRVSGAQDPLLLNNAISQLRQRRAELAAEYARMMVQFDPQYPAARAIREQLDALDSSIATEERRLLDRELNRTSSVRGGDYRAALEREQRLRSQVEQLKVRLDVQERDTIQYNIFRREADTNRQLYDALLQRYKEIGVAGVGANNIAIIDTAKVPDRPSKPSLLLNLLMAMVAGLILATVAILALDQIDESLRDPNQVSQLLHLPLLGTVPEEDDSDVLDLLEDAKSNLSEAYLSIRSNLAFSTDHGLPRSFMVTSSRPAEGKSTTSFALSTVLARTGKKVLLIDADMRSPSLHEFVGAGNGRGLSNFLAGGEEWPSLISSRSNGPDVISAGPQPPSAAELLSSDRMALLIKQLLERYDNVVIDSPPVLGLADAPLISRAVEGCVFVAESEGASVRGIKSAISRLQAVHAQIFGVVLTKMRQKSVGYGYGYDYGYGYGRDKEVEA